MKRLLNGILAACLVMPQVTYAQTVSEGRPDEGTSWKYFYFYKADTSEEQALADIIECYGYGKNLTVQSAGSNPTYTSVPYGGTTGLSAGQAAAAGAAGALLGALIGGLFDAGKRRAMERTNLRKCFGFKGYSRFELTKEQHAEVMEGPAEEVNARLVAMATGQEPNAERLVP